METLRPTATATATARLPSDVPAAAAAGGYPRWVMLEPYATDKLEVEDSEYSNSSCGGVKITEAASRSSDGHVVRVSLRLEAAPAASQLIFHCSPCSYYRSHRPSMKVVAAHGDSILVEMHYEKEGYGDYGIDYFVYNSGAGDGDDDPPRPPPSLSLLPTYWVPFSEVEEMVSRRHQGTKPHQLREGSTGLLVLRGGGGGGGDDELVVAELLTKEHRRRDTLEGAELVVLRSGEWSATPIMPIIHEDGKAEELSYWETDMAVPVGDRRLCWVDLYRGVILCDLLDDETPARLRYVSLPVEAPAGAFDDKYDRHGGNQRYCQITTRTVCAIDGGAGDVALRFVDIFSRCCCGSRGATYCDHSSNAFVINIWTLTIDDDDDMAWTMDAMIDATELWSLHAYAGLPRNFPLYPIVSIDDPNLICLIVAEERKRGKHHDDDETVRKIMVDTRSKALVSVWRGDDRCHWQQPYGCTYISVKIPDCFANYVSCSNVTTMPSAIVDKIPIATGISTNLSQSLPSESSPQSLYVLMASPEEILVALEEIPGLDGDDLLRAYSILCRDNGRLFRALMGLPMSMRKKWLLIEIKAYLNYHICSTCTTDHLQHD